MRGIYRASDESLDVDMNVVRSYAREANPSISLGEFPEVGLGKLVYNKP